MTPARVPQLAIGLLLWVVGPVCVFGAVETTEQPVVQCGGPAVSVMRREHQVREDCRTDAGDQFWGGVGSFVVGSGLVVHWGWRFRRDRPQLRPLPRLRPPTRSRFTATYPLVPTAGGAGLLRLTAHALFLDHPYLSGTRRLPLEAIAAVVPVASVGVPDQDHLAFGDPLTTNVAVVLGEPLEVGPFTEEGVRRLGLDGGLPVSTRVLTLAVEGTPRALLADLANHGVARDPAALERVPPVAPPAPRDPRWTARRLVVAGGFVVALLFGLPPALLGGKGGGLAATEVVLAVVLAAVVAAGERHWWPQASGGPAAAERAAVLAVGSLVLAGLPALVAALVPVEGGLWAVEWALAAGVPAGMLAGWALHVVDAPDLAW